MNNNNCESDRYRTLSNAYLYIAIKKIVEDYILDDETKVKAIKAVCRDDDLDG